MHSPTAVEQILGRIMRLPQAKAKRHPELNKAYAFAASAHFAEVARALGDALVQNGFEKQEVRDLIVKAEPAQTDLGPLFTWQSEAQKVDVPVPQSTALESLAPEIAAKVSYDAERQLLTIRERLEASEVYAVKNCYQDPQGSTGHRSRL